MNAGKLYWQLLSISGIQILAILYADCGNWQKFPSLQRAHLPNFADHRNHGIKSPSVPLALGHDPGYGLVLMYHFNFALDISTPGVS